ncbi:MAG: sensor domain-containing diguanylate cyclase [Candidatus Baltobacteraceae bacterium]
MNDHALVWNTDSQLQVTSLSARLRGFAGTGSGMPLRVSDLFGQDDSFSLPVAAHQWALDGEHLTFEAEVRGEMLRFDLQPLLDTAGATIGVAGRASELRTRSRVHARVLEHAQQFAGMGTWHQDLRTGTATLSDGLAPLLGSAIDPQSFDIRAFDHPDDRDAIARAIESQGDGGYTCDHRIASASGRIRAVRERVRTIVDDRGVPIARIGTLTDISDFKEREAELSELALYDGLTRLPNRSSLDERLSEALARCKRNDRRCGVLFADLDDFKAVNDVHGHDFGDRVLASVADRLNRNVRGSDTVARLGGDEFVILIDELFSDEAAVDAARKILRSFDDPFVVDDRAISLSASIGIATFPRCGSTPNELLKAADCEMYAVKRNGGSGVKLAARREETAFRSDENPSCPADYSPDQDRLEIRESA